MGNVTVLTHALRSLSDHTHTLKTHMSQRRNTFFNTSRSRYTMVGALAVAGLAACSADRVSAPVGPVPSAVAAFEVGSDKDAAERKSDAQLTAIAPTWHTSATDVEAPTTKPLDLACGVRGMYMVSQRIGKSGGSLRFGNSELKIPSGALASDVTVSATITLGQGVDVQFAPHGLKFAKAAELRVDYTGCTVPAGSAVNVYYTDDQSRITQTMPSAASTSGSRTVRTLTDHFSGFVVGWGRTAAY